MDYLSAFRPIFAYAAHLKLALPGQDGGVRLPPDALNHLEAMLAQTYAECRAGTGQGFENAWLALLAWIDEALALGLASRYFPGVRPADAFFDSLDSLLGDDGNKTANAEVIKVYATALDLRFVGNRAAPEALPELENYRQRCNNSILRLVRPVAPLPPPPAPGRPGMALVRDAALWIVPLAVTIFLYAVYRILLSDLYASVVG